jgi:dTDP-4-dehydrorhamnose 3,5-epimerase
MTMHLEPLAIHQAFLVRIEPHADVRGFFARTFCAQEFAAAGLPSTIVQASISVNRLLGTVRGLHFQWPPSREGKLVTCVRGRLFDVLLDLRPDSPSYLKHVSVVLDEDNRDAVMIPDGVAHGFQTLAAATEVVYHMTDAYAPELGAGFRWNDPSFGIQWPISAGVVISERDTRYPDFDRDAFESELRRRSDEHCSKRVALADEMLPGSGGDLP